MVLGAGRVGQLLTRKLMLHPEYGLDVVGIVASKGAEFRSDLGRLRILGTPHELPELVERLDVDRVIVAADGAEEEQVELVHRLKPLGVAMAGPETFDPYKD